MPKGIELVTLIAKTLANAPTIAAQKMLDELTDNEDIKIAYEIFRSAGLDVKMPNE